MEKPLSCKSADRSYANNAKGVCECVRPLALNDAFVVSAARKALREHAPAVEDMACA